MSKSTYLSRYLIIYKAVKTHEYISFEALEEQLLQGLEDAFTDDLTQMVSFSKRTLQRDLNEIRNLFKIDIQYSRKDKGYYLEYEGNTNESEALLYNFEMQQILTQHSQLTHIIQLETRKSQGLEYIPKVISAIKSKRVISVDYAPFDYNESKAYDIEPYLLKEYRNRWYIVGLDLAKGQIKSYALDRVHQLNLLSKTIQNPLNFKPTEYFEHCFGIIRPKTGGPTSIVLKFTPEQGKYIKSMPLHKSQTIQTDNDEELSVELFIYITYDFIMELRSFGNQIMVMEPNELRLEIYNNCTYTLSNYDKY